MTATDAAVPPLEPPRVMVVAPAASASVQAIVAGLRREAIQVELATPSILDDAPAAPVYVISMDPGTRDVLAARFVAWAADGELRAGLIALVEHGTGADCEELLAAGFDDAVVLPATSTRELVARVRAVHRRVHWKGFSNGRMRFGELTLDLYGRELWVDGKTVQLTSVELAVLRELIKARGKPLSRAELLDQAWGDGEPRGVRARGRQRDPAPPPQAAAPRADRDRAQRRLPAGAARDLTQGPPSARAQRLDRRRRPRRRGPSR